MPNARILNWNIQNCDSTSARFLDIVEAAAMVVVDDRIDILVLPEVNTKDGTAADDVCSILSDTLSSYDAGHYQTCIMSPNTEIKFDAFFIRDTTFTTPRIYQ